MSRLTYSPRRTAIAVALALLALPGALQASTPMPDPFVLGGRYVTPGGTRSLQDSQRDWLHQVSRTQSETDLQNWVNWMKTLPLEGREPILTADTDFLLADVAKRPPVGGFGTRLEWPERPTTVLVLRADGTPCPVVHAPGASAAAYLAVCHPDSRLEADEALLVQPDGSPLRFNIAAWNAASQPAPAPGAAIYPIPREARHRYSVDSLQGVLIAAGPFAAQPAWGAPRSLAAGFANASDQSSMALSLSDFGEVGLIQTPSARFHPEGHITFNFSRGPYPYDRLSLRLTPYPWLEAGFQYTNIDNRLYGPTIAGNQSYKDKGFDAKIRLLEETYQLPQIAVGFRDLAGTGLFSGEYLVASKRFGRVDFSAGIGWGYLAGGSSLSNPLGVLDPAFDTRGATEGPVGGDFNPNQYFRGPAALFAGLEYQPASDFWNRFSFKLEVEGNRYTQEPFDNAQSVNSRLNAGVVYRITPNTAVSVGFERGNRFMVGLQLNGNIAQQSTPKTQMAAAPRFVSTVPATTDINQIASRLQSITGWVINRVEQREGQLIVEIEQVNAFDYEEPIRRANLLLHALSAGDVIDFQYRFSERGLRIKTVDVNRQDFYDRRARFTSSLPPEEFLLSAYPVDEQERRPVASATLVNKRPWSLELAPTYTQNIGGPDGFILAAISAQAKGEYRFSNQTWLSATGLLRIVDNYDNFKYDAPSGLPRVRTDLRRYLIGNDVTLPEVQVNHSGQLTNNLFYLTYGGMFESMFGGVGGEMMWRPLNSPIAIGVDLNYVKQRGFQGNFDFRSYTTTTGHLSIHLDTGYQDIQATLRLGKYLAKDKGATLELARTFSNGATMGVFVTKTDVPAEQFGEGGFDKGMFVRFPLEINSQVFKRGYGGFTYQPLTRDGGASLNRSVRLFDLTSGREPQR